jgi:hypothetical protein
MRRHFSPALVVSVLALVLACTAGATAASSLITGKQIRDHSITGADLKRQSVGGDALAAGAISPDKLSGALAGAIMRQGPGPMGPTGPQGAAGPAGPGTTGVITAVTGSGSTIPPGKIGGAAMFCPVDQRAISGGWYSDSGYATRSRPTSDNKGWEITIDNSGSAVTANLTIYLSCVDAGQVVAGPR